MLIWYVRKMKKFAILRLSVHLAMAEDDESRDCKITRVECSGNGSRQESFVQGACILALIFPVD